MSALAAEASTRRLRISQIAVVALALASSYFILATIRVGWYPAGDFGINIDGATAVVNYLDPRDAAKGIRLGDRVELGAMSFRERGYLSWFRKVVALLSIATGVILAWNRPSVMLGALAVYLIEAHDYLVEPLWSPGVAALIILTYGIISSLGLPALIVFAARFPTGRASSATKYWDVVAAGTFVFFFSWSIQHFIPLFTARPIGDLPDALMTIVTTCAYVLVFVALCVKALKRNRSPRAVGFAWIVAGYGVGGVLGRGAFNELFELLYVPYWALALQQLLVLALPASVAYSIIRHRSFDLGYLANRTLVYSALTIGIGWTFFAGVWTATLFPSTLTIGASMFVALLVGIAFQAQRARAVRFVDRLFLPHRHEVAESLDRIGERLRGTGDPKRLTDEVASTLGLASVAVFARAHDGGFVRAAACGWPEGTTWHFLPDEPLTRSLEASTSIVAFADGVDANDEEPPLPVSHARPRVALTLRRDGRVEHAILVGAARNGASLDRDAIRSLHTIFDGALVTSLRSEVIVA